MGAEYRGKSLFCIVIKLKPVFEFVTFPLACLCQPPIFVTGSNFFLFFFFFNQSLERSRPRTSAIEHAIGEPEKHGRSLSSR